MHISDPTILFYSLNSIKKLGSPQISAYDEDNLMSRPLCFPFRFKDVGIDDQSYLKLINLVTAFDGKIAWCMYNYKSSKNYVIEPLMFYSRRRELKSGDDSKLISSFGETRYLEIMNDAIEDLQLLSKFLKESFNK